jgi:hypothetical protein
MYVSRLVSHLYYLKPRDVPGQRIKRCARDPDWIGARGAKRLETNELIYP